MFPGSFMMGAKDRLLAPSIPYRFFVTAVLFHIAGWATLLLAGADVTLGFLGGPGWVLAGLHMITLGTLAMSALGAAIQLLPVATRRPLGPVWAIKLMYLLFAPGVALLVVGLGTGIAGLQHGGASLAVAALLIFAWLVVTNQRQVIDLPGVTRHVWLSMVSLLALAVLGLLLVVDFTKGFLADHAAIAAAHAAIAAYGFMGMLAFGFSTVLLPMFVMGQAVPDKAGKQSALAAGVALATGGTGAILGVGWLAALGAALGLVAMAIYARAMRTCLKSRMKKRLEPFFRLVWVAAPFAPLSLVAAMALSLGAPLDPLGPLWGFWLVFGWLLSFVTALLQRIMPFLASMHSSALGGKPALLSELAPRLPVDIHLGCQAAAVVLITAALAGGGVWPLRLGLGLGLAGAISFGVFTVEVLRRYRNHMTAAAAAAQLQG
jgi:hypothetical protein